MIPSKRLLWLVTGWLAFSFVASAMPMLNDTWLVVSALVILITLADAMAAYFNKATPIIERRIAANLPVGVWREVTLRFAHPRTRGGGRMHFQAFDHTPPHCDVENLPITLTLAPGNFAMTKYRFRPDVRGDLTFGRVALRITSPFGRKRYFVIAKLPGAKVKVMGRFSTSQWGGV